MIHPSNRETDGRAIAYSALLSRAKNCVKISSYSDKNCRRRSILETTADRQNDRMTKPQTDTSRDNLCRYKAEPNRRRSLSSHYYELKYVNINILTILKY